MKGIFLLILKSDSVERLGAINVLPVAGSFLNDLSLEELNSDQSDEFESGLQSHSGSCKNYYLFLGPFLTTLLSLQYVITAKCSKSFKNKW